MLGRHRRISEELLYLARRRIYSSRRTTKVMLPSAEEPHGAMGPTLHDSWTLPVMKVIPPSRSRQKRRRVNRGLTFSLTRSVELLPSAG